MEPFHIDAFTFTLICNVLSLMNVQSSSCTLNSVLTTDKKASILFLRSISLCLYTTETLFPPLAQMLKFLQKCFLFIFLTWAAWRRHVTFGDLWSVFVCLHVHSFNHDGVRVLLRHSRHSSHAVWSDSHLSSIPKWMFIHIQWERHWLLKVMVDSDKLSL